MTTVSQLLFCLSMFPRLGRGDAGQDLIEYAMLAGLVSLIAIGAVTAVGTQVNAVLWAPTAATF